MIEGVHKRGLIYRDIKPDNFLLGLEDGDGPNGFGDDLFLIDFGMAKWYKDPKTHKHIPYRERKSLSGTARYMSINTHLGREQSRRDDLESVGHVIFYFARGGLPWQGLKATSHREKCDLIAYTKQTTPISSLLVVSNGNGGERVIPNDFGRYLEYCRELEFDEEPNYEQCKSYFRPHYKSFDKQELKVLYKEFAKLYVFNEETITLSKRHPNGHGNRKNGDNDIIPLKKPKNPRQSWWSRLLCMKSPHQVVD